MSGLWSVFRKHLPKAEFAISHVFCVSIGNGVGTELGSVKPELWVPAPHLNLH